MGPEATAHFLTGLVALTPAQEDADQVPAFLNTSPQIASRIDHIIVYLRESPTRTSGAHRRALEKYSSSTPVMPCTITHWLPGDIGPAVSVLLLNMVNLSAAEAAQRHGLSGGADMLGSPAIRKTRLSDAPVPNASLELVSSHADLLLNLIQRIKAGGGKRAEELKLRSIASAFRDQGANSLVIACSELSMVSALSDEFDAIDTVDVRARASTAFYTSGSAFSEFGQDLQ